MKKIALSVLTLSSACCVGILNAEPIKEYQWSGLYLGANAGYWWSQNNAITTVGTPAFINSIFPSGGVDIANALALLGTNNFSNKQNGFIGGGQIGYNYQTSNKLVVGLDLDLDGAQSNNTSTINQVIPLASFPENYTSSVSVSKKINYLGTVRGRLGFLYTPSLLFYGIGGLAYGGLSLGESFVASESLGSCIYPTVLAKNNHGEARIGWTLGGGGEWMFKPQWSVKMEYVYYDLGIINKDLVLTQIDSLGTPPGPWSTANVHSSARFTFGTVRLGLNYFF